MKILALDTATRTCSVALTDGDRILGESLLSGRQHHTESLLRLVDELLGRAGLSLEMLDALAVSIGPGSFTGLRVGMSTAKGLAFAAARPVIGISTLEVLASQAGAASGLVCPMLDARKEQVYTCLYEASAEGRLEKMSAEVVADPGEWISNVPSQLLFVGDGARRYREMIRAKLGDGAGFAAGFTDVPRASVLAHIARESCLGDGSGRLAEAVPLYVRKPDAEVYAHMKRGSFRPVLQERGSDAPAEKN